MVGKFFSIGLAEEEKIVRSTGTIAVPHSLAVAQIIKPLLFQILYIPKQINFLILPLEHLFLDF